MNAMSRIAAPVDTGSTKEATMPLFIHDYLKVSGGSDHVASWINANQTLITELAWQSWSGNHGNLPARLDEQVRGRHSHAVPGPFVDVLGPAEVRNHAVAFNMVWAIGPAVDQAPVLAGDLKVGPYPESGTFIELRATCRDLVGWLADRDNIQARQVMLQTVRAFLQGIDGALKAAMATET